MNLVFVEVDSSGAVLRILKTTREAVALPADRVREMERADAVKDIRLFVYERCGGTLHGECEWCGAPVTFDTGHMHEKHFKGRGGEVSKENCVFICPGCHIGRPDSAHGDRRWQTAIQEIPEDLA